MAILLTGGTGKTSLGTAKLCQEAKIPYVIATRKGQEGVPSGMTGTKFEWTDSSTFESALNYKFPNGESISAVYLVPPRDPNPGTYMNPFINLAIKHGVKRFVLCTGSSANKDGGSVGTIWQHLSTTGVEYTVLLATWFMENFLGWQHHATIKNEGKIYSACAEGKIPFISAADISAVAFRALTDKNPPTETSYRILGPELLTYDQIAAKMSNGIGREVKHVKISEDEVSKRYQGTGMPMHMADFLARIEVETANGVEERKGNAVEKGGSGGKWQTPHQKAKMAAFRGRGTIEPGDVGIWATCARNQEGRATTELRSLLYQCAERYYGIAPDPEEDDEAEDDLDIEASIRKEAASMGNKECRTKLFSPVRLDIECVLFFKVGPPIDPIDFVHRICTEVASKPSTRWTRYVNRLTPMKVMGKATEKGLEEVARSVLGEHFLLNERDGEGKAVDVQATEDETKPPGFSYAIRPTIRNHETLKRDVVIKSIASFIAGVHKVNLTKPDKVILVEIYQTVCGMSVVGSNWEKLKRYNIAELYESVPSVGTGLEAGVPDVVHKSEVTASIATGSSG
ncbi:hypothetical protein G7Y89_g155 [Cudoniella acicularis]|uniref:THUMP domain-containing protein n=1 Tax=Cudoniella acicularis TaxID=354080 RepID=A0A8H4RZB3_9HELO|nr:hypothetical protein G7Y89_g155 [Cudoniella acicularis]